MSSSKPDLKLDHLRSAAAFMADHSIALSAQINSRARVEAGTFDPAQSSKTSCSACAAPRQHSTYRTYVSKSRRKGVHTALQATCQMCGQQDQIVKLDRASIKKLDRPIAPVAEQRHLKSEEQPPLARETSEDRKPKRRKKGPSALQEMLQKSQGAASKSSTNGLNLQSFFSDLA
jgi:hypothetical protein